jgi:hypothetical protein
MDGGAIQRAAPVANAAQVRSDLTPARPSAPVESAPQKVVPPVGETAAALLDTNETGRRMAEALIAFDRRRSEVAEAQVQRKTEIDDEAKKVVTTWVDEKTGQVVKQFPAEDTLRLSAYVRDLLEEKEGPGVIA